MSDLIGKHAKVTLAVEFFALIGLFFIYAGDPPPSVNEAHYLVKAKNFWNPEWCANDLFASSGKAHFCFYAVLGWLTKLFTLQTTAWIGRSVGWAMLAWGLMQIRRALELPVGASVLIAIVWIASIEHGNLAGEWVVGGIEAKVPAYGLVLMGIAEILRRRWTRVWLLFGLASAFHVLTGGWSVVAGAFAFWMTERSPWRDKSRTRVPFFSTALFLGGVFSLAGLLPALAMSAGATHEESIIAAKTYVFTRISHHLLPSALHADWYLRHGVLTLVALGLAVTAQSCSTSSMRSRLARITWFAIGAMLVSVCGLLLEKLPGLSPGTLAKLLRFYWFRLADAATPLLLGISAVSLLTCTAHMRFAFVRRLITGGLCIIATYLVLMSAYVRVSTGVPVSLSNRLLNIDADASYAQQRRVMADWLAACRFIRASTPEDEVLLTPRHQQSFKWYAHRAEVVNWKDIPQDVASLEEWTNRMSEVYPSHLSGMRVTISYSGLREFARKYGVRWMLVDRRVVGDELPLVQIYPGNQENNQTYAVYQLPGPIESGPIDSGPIESGPIDSQKIAK